MEKNTQCFSSECSFQCFSSVLVLKVTIMNIQLKWNFELWSEMKFLNKICQIIRHGFHLKFIQSFVYGDLSMLNREIMLSAMEWLKIGKKFVNDEIKL